jgi:two-component system chemotaxis sensor kinase CheA
LIITALLVQAGRHSFAVHQDAIQRVIRVEPGDYSKQVQMASLGRTFRMGDEILPFLSLSEVLGISSKSKAARADSSSQALSVLVLEADNLRYALGVDDIADSEEIVVNRIQPYFNPKDVFAGATFMGDGSVGLILNIKGIAEMAGVKAEEARRESQSMKDAASDLKEASLEVTRNFLLFKLASKAVFGVPLEQVFRLEEFDSSKIRRSGAERVIVYRDGVMPLYSIEKILKLASSAKEPEERPTILGQKIAAIVTKSGDGYFGLQVDTLIDIASTNEGVSDTVRDRKGIIGNAFIRDQNVTILDLSVVLGMPLSA